MTGGVGSLAAVVREIGGDLYDGGRRAVVPGLGHSSSDRSVSLLVVDGRVIVHSFAGDDWRVFLDGLRRRGLVDGQNRLIGYARDTGPVRPSRAARLAAASALWASANELRGTLGEAYVRARGVTRAAPAALRFHPCAPTAVYLDQGPRRPALVAEIRGASGEFAGVELTYLSAGGGVASMATPRKTIGGRPAGSAVRLDPPGPELVVGEGVFSCLSASQALALPTWALLAVGNLRSWTPPSGVTRVIIAGDRGAAGEAGAATLASRLGRLGVRAQVSLPPPGFADWNDAVCGRTCGG